MLAQLQRPDGSGATARRHAFTFIINLNLGLFEPVKAARTGLIEEMVKIVDQIDSNREIAL
jgi:hypothetical protein